MPQYAYDKTNGNRIEKQESPLEPGVYLQPGDSVDTAPPTFDNSTHIAKWSDETSSWTVEEKYEGPFATREEQEEYDGVDLTDADLANTNAADVLRAQRDGLLEETDIFATISVDGPAMSTAVRNYRQALRDLPANVSNPQIALSDDRRGVVLTNVTWPNVPQEVLDRR